MAEREQGIKNLASKLLGGRISTDPAVTRLVSRSSTTSESPSAVASPTSATLLLLLLYLCDSQGASADPPKRWGNASSTWGGKEGGEVEGYPAEEGEGAGGGAGDEIEKLVKGFE